MKLLPKKLINATLATERKQAIDQGVKLAEKVDGIRETLAKEEKRLAEFRTLSVAHVQTEIDAKLREKNGVEREIMVRQEELKRLREPLDAEWATLNEGMTALEWKKKELLEKLHQLNEGINLNIRRERMNKEEEQRVTTQRTIVDADTELALDAKKSAQQELAKARKEADTLLSNAEAREKAVAIREAEIAAREQEVKNTKKRQAKRDIEQNNRDRALTDKYTQLLTTQQQLKK